MLLQQLTNDEKQESVIVCDDRAVTSKNYPSVWTCPSLEILPPNVARANKCHHENVFEAVSLEQTEVVTHGITSSINQLRYSIHKTEFVHQRFLRKRKPHLLWQSKSGQIGLWIMYKILHIKRPRHRQQHILGWGDWSGDRNKLINSYEIPESIGHVYICNFLVVTFEFATWVWSIDRSLTSSQIMMKSKFQDSKFCLYFASLTNTVLFNNYNNISHNKPLIFGFSWWEQKLSIKILNKLCLVSQKMGT